MTLDIYLVKKGETVPEPITSLESGIVHFQSKLVKGTGICVFKYISEDGQNWGEPENVAVGLIPYSLTVQYTPEQRIVIKGETEQHPITEGQTNYLSPLGDGLILLEYNKD